MTENTTIKLNRYGKRERVVIEKLDRDDPLRDKSFSPVAKIENGAELWGIEKPILINEKAFDLIEETRKLIKKSGADYNREYYEKYEPYFDIIPHDLEG